MDAKTEKTALDRRSFLRGAGLGTAGAAAAIAASVAAAPPAKAAAPAQAGEGYRETPHVKTFYQTARF
ncbi:MAG: hypothetical protein OHK0024_04090 [Thalassobaculales bacterium]